MAVNIDSSYWELWKALWHHQCYQMDLCLTSHYKLCRALAIFDVPFEEAVATQGIPSGAFRSCQILGCQATISGCRGSVWARPDTETTHPLSVGWK